LSLKLKITLLLSSWLILILFLFNVFVFYFFIKASTNSEIELLRKKAETLLERNIVDDPNIWNDPTKFNDLLIPQEMVRLIDRNNNIKANLNSQQLLTDAYPPKFKALAAPSSSLKLLSDRGFAVFVQVPVYKSLQKDQPAEQLAMLEIGKRLDVLDRSIPVLFTILAFTSIGAVVVSLIGGYFYTRIIFNPIRHLTQTMVAIQKSGTFKRLQIDSNAKNNEISQLGSTFNDMIARLEENFERQKQFIADASHELRTPLTIIESYAALLRRWASSDPQLRQEAIDAIHSEAVRLRELTNNLLVFMDTDEEQRMKWVFFDLSAMVLSTASSLQLTFEREIKVYLHHEEGESIEMKGDPEKMKQLLIILLDNAIKYSQKPIEVRVDATYRHIHIYISDQGIGIAEADIPKLFDRFYRTDKARSRKHGGIGLGLSIAEQIVQLHEGTIRVTSRLNEGTTVIIRLPKKQIKT
jgi:two-component system sensor histidine kinase ArlS